MTMMLFRAAFLTVLFAALSVLSVSAQTVKGSIANGTVTRGTAAKATVTLTIPGGLHVNSSRPNGEYAIATTVRPSAPSGVKVGAVNYPKGTDRKFEFSEKALNVYEGRVNFSFPVTASSTFRGREVVVSVTVRYQACTNEVCYSPKTKTITLKARVG
jgi:DsbC/DsbD-like thiol-disulfide interchange protein